ncbi:hypothetical protein V8C42DRAFT_232680 [Trichoderma barbatum]
MLIFWRLPLTYHLLFALLLTAHRITSAIFRRIMPERDCVTNQYSYLISQVPKLSLAYHNAVMVLCSCVCVLLGQCHDTCPVPLPSVHPKTPQADSFFPLPCSFSLSFVGSFLLGA